ncbi:DUF202 domain-containing protein [Lentzea albida]|uniref:Uncharacterized membrane protein YidH, DUF202 family n=1 Tax=Lentzea albida TaxID=65499 RepID=A0A1H9WSF1_9PSEU|nr:DUF202 domain-containing protein [Lentzea albida]SES36848.1 Uncharacterized membrane protein YidH, DUF202 family [Lentzea albida]
MSTPFDSGLQPERTLLAWRRTCLALAVACATSVKFAAEAVGGGLAVGLGLAGIALAGWAYLASALRYGRVLRGLVRAGTAPSPGVPVLALAATTVLLGLACVAYLVHRVLG